jgi:guanosine-3',5'-bis(diphosphate) 3'-pyrophosphohydrolase
MEFPLEKIKQFAAAAHGPQMRKYTPQPYIVHPIRVMELCKKYNGTLPVLAAALLHDVLEDTTTTKEDMFEFLTTVMNEQQAKYTLQLVVDLTDVFIKKDYPQWNRRKRKQKEADRIEKTTPDSQTIKYADIIDNCTEIVKYDPEFGAKFLHECRMILKRIPKGHPELYKLAVETVEKEIQNIGPIK